MKRIAVLTIVTGCFLAACGTGSTPDVNDPNAAAGQPGATTGGVSTDPNDDVPVVPAVCVTNTKVDVNVTVTSKLGPQGAASPRPISNNMWSMNIDDQIRTDYYPTPNATFVAFLKALKPAQLRWPAGYYGQQYTFMTSGAEGPKNMTPALIDAFVAMARQTGAQPYLAVNLANGTAANAAQFVQYVNVTKKYGVTWWELGNEPDVNYYVPASGFTPQVYASSFLSFSKAMKAVDPTIKLVGAEIMTGADLGGIGGFGTCGATSNNNCDWLTPILAGTASAPMDAIAWHYYPMDSSQSVTSSGAYASIPHLLQEDATDWPPAGMDFASQVFPVINKLKAQYAPKAQVWVDEFAEDSGKLNGVGVSNVVAGDLWSADTLGRFAEYGADATFHFIFKGGAEHGYALLDTTNTPRPEYYTYWLYAQQFGDTMVSAKTDSIAVVSPHAALRSDDGSLRVMLVNKSTSAQNVRVTLPDFAPKTAQQYTLQGSALNATTVTLNGQALTATNIVNGANAVPAQSAQACKDNIVSVPATSVVLLVFKP